VRTWLREHWLSVVVTCVVTLAVFAAGYAAHKPAVQVVTVTEYKDRVVEHTVTVEKPVIQYRDRVITRTVEKPDGTKIETHVTEQSGKQTGEKVTTVVTDTQRQVAQRQAVAPEGRWSFDVTAGANTWGSVLAGVETHYRLVGPLQVGAWVLVPVAGSPGAVAAGISLGLRL